LRFTGAVRDGDIPGNMIPALYYIYERDGDPFDSGSGREA
jgi:hypothetical protein